MQAGFNAGVNLGVPVFTAIWGPGFRASIIMHFYDTQLYVSFENNAPEQQSTAVTRLNTCIGDIRNWLANNMLKLNDDKTEVILFTYKHALKSHPNVAVTVGEQSVRPATSIHNLGVVYDQPLSMIQHVNSVCRVGYIHVRNIGRIRRYLTEDATKTIPVVHALVTSRLDYCNAVLYGLPASVTNKMQRLQNTCAQMITKKRRRDHITPMLHCGRSRHRRSLYLVQEQRRTVTVASRKQQRCYGTVCLPISGTQTVLPHFSAA